MNQDQNDDEFFQQDVQSEAQQQPQEQEDPINNDLLKSDLKTTLHHRFKQLILQDGYQIITTRESFGKLIFLCGFLIVELYIGAVLFDNITRYLQYPKNDVLIKDTVPWGVIYIIITIPVIIIQGAGCKILKNKKNNYIYLAQYQDNNEIQFSNNQLIYQNTLGQIINVNYICLLLVLQYFAPSFWMALLNMVLIDWLTTLPQKLLTQIFYFLYNIDYLAKYQLHKIQNWIYQHSQIGLYRFLFEIPQNNNNLNEKQEQESNIQYQPNQENEIGDLQKLEKDLLIKLEKLYQELELEPGYQLSLIKPQETIYLRIFWAIMVFTFLWQCYISEAYLPLSQLEATFQLDSYIYVLLTIPILLIQGPGFKLFNSKERKYNTLTKDYQKIRTKLGLYQNIFPWPHQRLMNLRNYKLIEQVILCLALLGLQYFSRSITEALLNCLIVEFIGQFQDTALDNMFLYVTSLQYIFNNLEDNGLYHYIVPYNCQNNTDYQVYSKLWDLDINLQELQSYVMPTTLVLTSIIKRLRQQVINIFHKSQMKFAFISLSLSLYTNLFWLFLSICFVILVNCSIINYWLTLPSEYIWINDTRYPWGVLYLQLIIPIIIIQGVGLKEVERELRIYRKFIKDAKQIAVILDKLPWNHKNYEVIETLFISQTFLFVCLLIPAIYMSPNCQTMLLTLIIVQFTFTFNKNAQENLYFNLTNFEQLRMNWRSYDQVLDTNVLSFKAFYRFYWNIIKN